VQFDVPHERSSVNVTCTTGIALGPMLLSALNNELERVSQAASTTTRTDSTGLDVALPYGVVTTLIRLRFELPFDYHSTAIRPCYDHSTTCELQHCGLDK